MIANEVLATSYQAGQPSEGSGNAGFAEHTDDLLGLRFRLRRA